MADQARPPCRSAGAGVEPDTRVELARRSPRARALARRPAVPRRGPAVAAPR
ncbi:hypothetical protein C7S16_4204 [Burkholderia thailandensis]|uniref:Uncharacterized protein n=1 Tax=Burkholderia thailandensis TaxID=57975 RepID=A0AAW9CM88_BURTH|nr:hypothetical protein [Burkholderia thailandensis]